MVIAPSSVLNGGKTLLLSPAYHVPEQGELKTGSGNSFGATEEKCSDNILIASEATSSSKHF